MMDVHIVNDVLVLQRIWGLGKKPFFGRTEVLEVSKRSQTVATGIENWQISLYLVFKCYKVQDSF